MHLEKVRDTSSDVMQEWRAAVAETCDHAGIPAQRVSTTTEVDLQRMQ